MGQPYIGEIRMFGGNFAPVGWAFCQGQVIPISENDALFTLIGTTYGGDGQQTFALPNLASRVPIHTGTNPNNGQTYVLAQAAGVEQVTITAQTMPTHSHPFMATSNNATVANASGNVLAQTPTYQPYIAATPNTPLAANAVTAAGGSQPHTNLQPYLAINFIISLYGVFPSQT